MTQTPYLPPAPDANGTIHIVVPLRPGADLDLLRAQLEGVAALQSRSVRWHVPVERGDIVALATEAAGLAKADGGLVVAAGGDGTINAVATAAWTQGVPMGVVPMGTFNYFARDQSLSLEPEDAVQDILKALEGGDMRPVSVGFVNERMFLVNASVGMYPRLLDERERASRKYGRTRWVAIASSIWSVMRNSSARRWSVAVRSEPQAPLERQEYLASTLFVGNNLLQLERVGIPQASAVAEGDQLAVVLLKPQERDGTAMTVLNAAVGQLERDDAVVSLSCTEMVVEPASWKPQRVKVAFDGEREWMAPPLTFRTGERPLWLVAPTATAKSDAPQAARAASADESSEPAAIPLPVPGTGLTPA